MAHGFIVTFLVTYLVLSLILSLLYPTKFKSRLDESRHEYQIIQCPTESFILSTITSENLPPGIAPDLISIISDRSRCEVQRHSAASMHERNNVSTSEVLSNLTRIQRGFDPIRKITRAEISLLHSTIPIIVSVSEVPRTQARDEKRSLVRRLQESGFVRSLEGSQCDILTLSLNSSIPSFSGAVVQICSPQDTEIVIDKLKILKPTTSHRDDITSILQF